MSHEVDPRKIEAKQRLIAGETIASIAARFGVNRKTIERWATEGNWREQKQAEKVVSINKPRESDEPAIRVRTRRQRGQIDELEIVEGAIVNLDLLLSGMCGASEDRPIDTRGIGSTAGALVKLLEYRRKIQPPTAAELAEQMIALGIPPTELVAELKRQWQLRA